MLSSRISTTYHVLSMQQNQSCSICSQSTVDCRVAPPAAREKARPLTDGICRKIPNCMSKEYRPYLEFRNYSVLHALSILVHFQALRMDDTQTLPCKAHFSTYVHIKPTATEFGHEGLLNIAQVPC